MSALIPYAGEAVRVGPRKPAPRFTRPQGDNLHDIQPLIAALDRHSEDLALAMFRDELRDTKEIAWRMEATEAAVANGIANARERARGC